MNWRQRLESLTQDKEDVAVRDWRERAESLLYDGETIKEGVSWDSSTVVVTSHRLLAFTPGTDGANFHQVDRPNVDGIDSGSIENLSILGITVKILVVGFLLVALGLTLDFESMMGETSIDTSGTGRVGFGGIMGIANAVFSLIRNIDTYMLEIGILMLVVGGALLAVYLYFLESTLVIRVAGGEDVTLPKPHTDVKETVASIENALKIEPSTTEQPSTKPGEPDRTDRGNTEPDGGSEGFDGTSG